MNGQLLPATPPAAACLPRRRAWSDDGAAALARLLAALALSCLLHAAAVFLPYLGRSAAAMQSALSARQEPPRVIDATLASAGERDNRDSPADSAPRAESPAHASATDRAALVPQPAARQRAAGVNLLPLPAPVYYTTDELSKRPQPLALADLDAPQIRPIVASGKIVLKLWINEFGVVADVAVEKTELPEIFSRTAVAAFKGLRFEPGERNGQPVGTVMRFEVSYDDGRGKPD